MRQRVQLHKKLSVDFTGCLCYRQHVGLQTVCRNSARQPLMWPDRAVAWWGTRHRPVCYLCQPVGADFADKSLHRSPGGLFPLPPLLAALLSEKPRPTLACFASLTSEVWDGKLHMIIAIFSFCALDI